MLTTDNNPLSQSNQKVRSELIKFFLITFFITWFFWLPSVLNSQGILNVHPAIPFFFGMPALFGPTIAALFLTFRENGKVGIKSIMKKVWNFNFNKKWLIPVIILPFSLFIPLLLIMKIQNFEPDLSIWGLPLVFLTQSIMIFLTGGPLAEEIGWRGYALDRVQTLLKKSKYQALVSSLGLGLVWGLWHLPLFFMEGTTQSYIPFYEFVLLTMVNSVFYTWLYNNTDGNLGIAMVFHLTTNLASAFIPFWYTDLGRWLGFISQLIIMVVVVKIYGAKWLKKEKIIELSN